jgi:adenylate kinase
MGNTFKNNAVILISPPFGGKNTQCSLIKKYLINSNRPFCLIATGTEFRLLNQNCYTAKLIKDRMDNGSLLPDFLPQSIVVNAMVKNLKKDDLLILNGYPRNKRQAEKFAEILEFFHRNPIVIFIKTSGGEIIKRFNLDLERGKVRENDEEILIHQLKIFDDELIPLVNFLKLRFPFKEIDGNRDLDDINKDIIKILSSR